MLTELWEGVEGQATLGDIDPGILAKVLQCLHTADYDGIGIVAAAPLFNVKLYVLTDNLDIES